MLISIQYARALAALLVVCAHLTGFAFFQPLQTREFGGMGVDIFFVISGFIIWESSKGQAPKDFAIRRFSRIVPAYWAYTTLLVVLALALPQLTPNIYVDARSLIFSYLFVPYTDMRGNTNPLLLQGWTLNYEMYFYVIFGLSLFIRNRMAQLGAIVAFFLASILLGILIERDTAVVRYYTDTMLLEFLLGILVNIGSKSVWGGVPFKMGCLVAGAGLLVVMNFGIGTELPRFLAFGVPAAVMLLGLIGCEDAVRRHRVRLFEIIGDSSYSLYLLHPFVLSGVSAALKFVDTRILPINGIAGAVLFGAVSLSVSIILADLSFRFFEKPVGRFLNGHSKRKRSDAPYTIAENKR